MNAFEIVTFAVAVVAIVIAIFSYLRLRNVLSQLGRRGGLWFDHADDLPVQDKPVEDEVDAPIPQRPLRGRAE
jgi:hypothetical protein